MKPSQLKQIIREEVSKLNESAMKGESLDEAQGNNLEAAIKDKSMYREFIDIMDQLTDIWYAAGYTKQDIVDYIDGMLPAENTSYNNL